MDIDKLTYNEKQSLFLSLAPHIVGAQSHDKFSILPIESSEVAPGCSACVSIMPHVRFKPERLVIFEPTSEYTSNDTIEEYENRIVESGSWWKREQRVERVLKERHLHQRKAVEVESRGLWWVTSLFVGNKCQMTTGRLGGELFGPGTTVTFIGDWCDPSITITIAVQNTSARPRKFHGALLGQMGAIEKA